MKKIIILFFTTVIVSLSIHNVQGQAISERLDEKIEYGTEAVRGFLFDNVLHSEGCGDIHFGLHIPDSYDGNKPYALFVTLPGYEGLYFQGIGVNIRAEDYGIESQK